LLIRASAVEFDETCPIQSLQWFWGDWPLTETITELDWEKRSYETRRCGRCKQRSLLESAYFWFTQSPNPQRDTTSISDFMHLALIP